MKQLSTKKRMYIILLIILMISGMAFLLYQNYRITHKRVTSTAIHYDSQQTMTIGQVDVKKPTETAPQATSTDKTSESDIVMKINSILNLNIIDDSRFKALEENYGPAFRGKPAQPHDNVIN